MSDLRKYFGEKFDADDATEKLYLTHDLTEDSVVFDVGGFEGDWAAEIWRRYHAHIYAFEPLYWALIRKRLPDAKVRVMSYGLASRDDFLLMAKDGPSSSLYREHDNREMCKFREGAAAAMEVLHVENVGDVNIDLMAINIEGGEYDLLRHMITSGLAYRCREIMVQFHMLWPDCYSAWKEIRAKLNETHYEVFCYPFVWEKWRRRP